jgi:hypothetical protein
LTGKLTIPNAITGKFFLAHLDAPANYDVVITADEHATKVIAGVPVPSSTRITTVSTTVVPITVDGSTTHSIGGTITLNPATDDDTVIVAAKQTFTSGPTVTVKSQVATVSTATSQPGDYAYDLTLPTGAPSLGPYSTPLPIVFTQQPAAVAGHYTIQSSATGYTTQSANLDISAGSATQNFTLTP